MERKHNLNISSKAIHNLKDSNTGERKKCLHSNDDFDKILCDSAFLIQNLWTDHDIECVDHYESCCTSKFNERQVKCFDSDSPVNIVGDVCNFPIEKIENQFIQTHLITHTLAYLIMTTLCTKLLKCYELSKKMHSS